MTPKQWHRVKELFEAALEHVPEDRSAFVIQACRGDDSLRSEVESLLSSYEQEENFLEKPAVAIAAQSLAKEESAALLGQELSHFKIEREIGRGGMGVVYLAHDTSLGRRVALKLLPKHLTSDPGRLRRFEREARAASALNHHNILTIYEIDHLDGLNYIATEFIDGDTLRERIESKELKLGDALSIAEQIASALVAAHEAGIVHRDIKPENVMIRRDGYIKVLDFGLAKLTEHEAVDAGTTKSAVAAMADTGVMGTVGYMSPEQAQGLSVDHRTDIFSLGVVIYEMVTGQKPFAAGSAVPTFQQDPLPITHYLPEAPTELQLLVTRALQHDLQKRYQTMPELLTDLKSVRLEDKANNRFKVGHFVLFAAALSVLVSGLLWAYSSRRTAKSSLPPVKVVPFTTFTGSEWVGGFSPDGNQIVFAWTGEQENNFSADIYVKQIGDERPLRLTSNSDQDVCPVWSPDGQTIGFIRFTEAGATILTVPARGGAERELIRLGPNVAFPPIWDWSPNGKFIAYSYQEKDKPFEIFLLSIDTLARHALTSPPGENLAELNRPGDSFPVFSPDGQSIAFIRRSSWLSSDIYVVSVAGGEPKRLTFNKTPIAGLDWSADGREIIFSENPLILEGNGSLWRIPVSGGTAERLTVGGFNAIYPKVSRHGNRLAYVQASGDMNIYRIELFNKVSKNPPVKLISSTRDDTSPQFSPDGKRIVFQSNRSGQFSIWTSDSSGADPRLLTTLDKFAGTPRWSPDGKQIVFNYFEERRGQIYVASADGGKPHPITTGDYDNIVPSWSADGKRIYFISNRSGVFEVWRVSAEGGEAVQVTRQGGRIAFESPDGKYVYYAKNLPTPGIWRLPVDGGEEVKILNSFNSELYGDWAVVEDGIYFINVNTKGEGALEFFDFTTRKVNEVAKLGKFRFGDQSIAISPDRRQVLYVQADHIGDDITLVENFR